MSFIKEAFGSLFFSHTHTHSSNPGTHIPRQKNLSLSGKILRMKVPMNSITKIETLSAFEGNTKQPQIRQEGLE